MSGMFLSTNQVLAIKQSVALSQILLQRFDILQQTSTEFEQSLESEANKNPFLKFNYRKKYTEQSNESGLSAIDFATYSESLMSRLVNQLDTQFLSEIEYNIVLHLIDEVDDKGYIFDYKNVRERIMTEYNVSTQTVFQCLKVLQSFEPEGVGARSLNECLWIQIDNHDLDDEKDKYILKHLVKSYLDDISQKNYQKIMNECDITESQLSLYISFISNLSPNPAGQFGGDDAIKILPSLQIRVCDGVIKLQNLEEERISLSMNETMVDEMQKDPSIKLKKQFNEAKVWLEHFKKRQNLLVSCGKYLINQQRLYFLEGSNYMVPCQQKDMAKALGVSDSTISRIARSKYIDCDHGIILIKQLCKRNIYGKTTTQVKTLVTYYCEKYPTLSDKKISEILKSIGLVHFHCFVPYIFFDS